MNISTNITPQLRHLLAVISLIILVPSIVSCGGDKFHVKGSIEGADDVSLLLERSDAMGRWVAIDSVRTSSKGDFSFAVEAYDAPDVYLLVCEGRYIYLPVDSTETVTVQTTLKGFGRDYTLEGSEAARKMAEFDRSLLALGDSSSAEALKAFKRNVFASYIQPGKGDIVSYYVLTKHLADGPLFDPADATDAKYYAAVATAFEQYKPDDPRTEMLRQISLEGLRKAAAESGKKRVVEAQEISYFDITLPDTEGNMRKLSELVGKGKPVMLVFSLMTDEKAPAFNREVRRVHDAGSAVVYQVSLDADRLDWRQAAANLPWINVYETSGTASRSLADYNITSLPACFLIDAAGNLTRSGSKPADLGL